MLLQDSQGSSPNLFKIDFGYIFLALGNTVLVIFFSSLNEDPEVEATQVALLKILSSDS